MSRRRLAVVGSINADLACMVPRLPALGETLLANEMAVGPGGKASNQSVALAKLGAEPLLIGTVGADALGDFVRALLEAAGVDTAAVGRSERFATGTAMVFTQPDGENAIVSYLGANAATRARDVPSLDGCDALLMTLGAPSDVLERAVAEARSRAIKTILDATPLREPRLPEALAAVDVLSANRVEAELLTGVSVESDEDAQVACKALHDAGAGRVVLKLGSQGAAWFDGAHAGQVLAPQVTPVDTTGAGDAFMAGLALQLAEGASLEDAARFGCAVGAAATMGVGAQGAWSTLTDVQALLDRTRP